MLNAETLDNYLQNFSNKDGIYQGDIGKSTYLIFPHENDTFKLSILEPENILRKSFDNFDSLQKFIEGQHEKYLSTLSPL